MVKNKGQMEPKEQWMSFIMDNGKTIKRKDMAKSMCSPKKRKRKQNKFLKLCKIM